jgi:SET domain-containing protein
MSITRRKKKVAKRSKARPRRSPAKPRLGPVNEWFELRRSPIHGLGAFAIQDIPKGTRLIEYTGERISNAEADRRAEEETKSGHHTFLFVLNSRTVLDATYGGNESMYINHSCDPNCEAVEEDNQIVIYALRDIERGQELVYDYNYILDEPHNAANKKLYPCHCGARNCRGTILAKKR